MFTIYKFQSFWEAWFDTVVEFMIENSRLSNNQLRFKQNDSYVNQLMSMNQSSFGVIDAISEVQCVLLDFSKEFGMVWNDSVLNKPKNGWINGNLSDLIWSFFHNRCEDFYYRT